MVPEIGRSAEHAFQCSISIESGVIEFVHSSSITVRPVLIKDPLMAHPASHYVCDTNPVGMTG